MNMFTFIVFHKQFKSNYNSLNTNKPAIEKGSIYLSMDKLSIFT